MQLVFENVLEVASGNSPNAVQFPDTSAQIFSTVGGSLFGTPIQKLDGEFSAPIADSPADVSPDTGITSLEIRSLDGFGAIGGYRSGNKHVLIIYELSVSMENYLENGTISHSINNPIAQCSLELQNPIDEDSETGANVAIDEHEALMSPGARILFEFSIGGSDLYDLGEFYVDRSNFNLLNETASADGRNLVGKALRDQTLDEDHIISYGNLKSQFENLLLSANISADKFLVENTSLMRRFEFDPNTTIFEAMEEMLKSTITWKMEELVDGTIVIGSPSYSAFNQKSAYTFERNRDIFSREIVRDDMNAFRRVCVHTSDFSVKAYKDVSSYSGWNLQAKKTLYAEIAEGTSQAEAQAYADELALRVEKVGKVETFEGPIRPHLTCGDEARIIDSKGQHILGLITELSHSFGKNGFTTTFTVDSGGRLGKGRFSDYINILTKGSTHGSISYEDILPEE